MDKERAPLSRLTLVYFSFFCGAVGVGIFTVLFLSVHGWGILGASLVPLSFAHQERRKDVEKFNRQETDVFE